MAQEKATVHPITPTQPPPTPETPKAPKLKATQALPSNKMTLAKQLAALRAYAAISGQNAKPVKLMEVADVTKSNPNTISTASAFFVATGLLQRAEGGFLPSAEVLAFQHAYEWDSTDATAAHKLAPVIAETWFAKETLKKLSFEARLKESDAVTSLAQYASAPPDCKLQVKQLLDWLEAVGIVQRDGDVLRKGVSATSGAHSARQPASTGGNQPPPPTEPEHREAPHREAQPARSNVSTAFSQMAGGAVQFNVTVKVDMNEFKGWQPERIAAFFHGIAEVLTAKGGMEREASQE